MFNKTIYRKLITVAITALFFIASLPKAFLHDVFANHHHKFEKDQPVKLAKDVVQKQQTCDCEDLYTDVVFQDTKVTYLIPNISFERPVYKKYNDFIIQGFCYKASRGPPAC